MEFQRSQTDDRVEHVATAPAEAASHSFGCEENNAIRELDGKRRMLKLAKELSPALVPALEAEVKASVEALERGREVAAEYESERAAHTQAAATKSAAAAALASNFATDRETIEKLIADVQFTSEAEAALGRREERARSRALSAFSRAGSQIAERTAADHIASLLVGAVLRGDMLPAFDGYTPSVIPWLAIAFHDARPSFREAIRITRESRWSEHNPPPTLADFDDAIEQFWGSLKAKRARAAQEAATLDAALGA